MKKKMLLLLTLVLMAGCAKAPEEEELTPSPTPYAESDLAGTGAENANVLCLVSIDGMEYAVRNPKSYPDSAVFLRRAEGDAVWEEVALKMGDSGDNIQHLENPMLAFSSKEEGILVFESSRGDSSTKVLATKDGGTTWEEKENIPEPGESEHQMVLCLAAAGQGRFVMGYRYYGESGQDGTVFLTKDGAETWQQVQMPIPKPAGMTFAYIEPVAFRNDGESLFLELCYRGDDAEGKRMEARYEAVSKDGGETWELVENSYAANKKPY